MIHPTAIIHPNVTIGSGVEIGPWCLVGSDHGPLRIPEGSVIRSHSIIEGDNNFWSALETGHHVLIRRGNDVGANLRIGSYSSLEGGGQIGDYVRIHGRCEMTKGLLNHFARIYGGTYITDNRLPPSHVNQPAVIGEGAVVAMNCVVIAGVTVGLGAFVGASTVVSKDVPPAHALVGGKLKPVTELNWAGYSYPWTAYFREYPPEAIGRIETLHQSIMARLR